MNYRVAYFDHDQLRNSIMEQLSRNISYDLKTFSKLEDLAVAASWRPSLIIWHGAFLAPELELLQEELKAPVHWLVGPKLPKWQKIGHHLQDPWKPELLLSMIEKHFALTPGI